MMKRDLVCGRLIDLADALWVEYHGKTYYFCSHSCKCEFEDRPDEYAEHASATLLSEVIFEPIRVLATAIQEVK
ncbi:MAG TPA: YHS domain-containing protein [Roseiflexaceae bacterium]|nr:YHS domain-containing protein [Roseiflexaceae bacterium]